MSMPDRNGYYAGSSNGTSYGSNSNDRRSNYDRPSYPKYESSGDRSYSNGYSSGSRDGAYTGYQSSRDSGYPSRGNDYSSSSYNSYSTRDNGYSTRDNGYSSRGYDSYRYSSAPSSNTRNDYSSTSAGPPRSSSGGYFNRSTAAPPPPSDMPVHKKFYNEHSNTSHRNRFEIEEWQRKHQITFKGSNVPNPVMEFNELIGLPEGCMDSMLKQGFSQPTVIQSQAWPFALSGRDFVGIAQTGSGKTLGFTLPALVHVEGNSHRHKHGPSVLILAPTRELAQQIKDVVNIFPSARAVCIFGGASKFGQRREMERIQPTVLIACPGRLIDFVDEGTISLANITFLVLDEADRMLDMGFEPQIRRIVEKISKNRQTLMWSATWPKEVRRLAEDFLVDYCQINIGSSSLSANHNITQIIDVCEEGQKYEKLYNLLTEVNANIRENKTIIFCETKRKVDDLYTEMKKSGWQVCSIHGDKAQHDRDHVLGEFRAGRSTVLIATDVAARGLDVDDIKFVVNFDFPSSTEDYVHRIGRTGRRDRKGTAYTFFTLNNAKQAQELIDILKEAKQPVPEKLYDALEKAGRYGRSVRSRYGGYGQKRSYDTGSSDWSDSKRNRNDRY